jgi:carbamoyltransferase
VNILGVSAFYHDSAAAIIKNDEIIAAAQEERFTRIKQDASFPVKAVQYCLEESGLSLNELDAIVFYDKPLLKFERLLETYYGYSPKGITSFLSSMPVWLKEKMFLKRLMYKELEKVEEYDKKRIKFLFPEHHLSHAASAFYPSPFEEAAILTIDGVGEWATASISHGKGNKIEVLKELHFPHSLGLLYSAFTYYLGFKVNSGEYKLMGLAPYGDPISNEVKNYIKLIKTELIDIKEDGSIWLNQNYFSYATGLRMIKEKQWENLFGAPTRKKESDFEQVHCNLGLAIQIVTEEIVYKMAKEAKKLTGSDNLCLAGGVALNCVSNGKLINAKIFKNIYIQPAAGDAGGALGAAQAAYYIHFDNQRIIDNSKQDSMKGSYLGCEYSDKEVEITLKKYKAVFNRDENFSTTCEKTAGFINEGQIIGWFQGRMEFGPRALGNRSIIGDPRNTEMQKKLNLKIKYRESFRPFAPSVLAEDVNNYFVIEGDSPYMLTVQPVKEEIRKIVSEDYQSLPMKEKLYQQRSTLPSITHVDFSARIQTVHKETNPKYWELINTFKKQSNCSLLINTSFNVRGEPIVCSPEDAYRCFMRTEMDYLVLNNYILKKEDQPKWTEKDHWQEEFVLD